MITHITLVVILTVVVLFRAAALRHNVYEGDVHGYPRYPSHPSNRYSYPRSTHAHNRPERESHHHRRQHPQPPQQHHSQHPPQHHSQYLSQNPHPPHSPPQHHYQQLNAQRHQQRTPSYNHGDIVAHHPDHQPTVVPDFYTEKRFSHVGDHSRGDYVEKRYQYDGGYGVFSVFTATSSVGPTVNRQEQQHNMGMPGPYAQSGHNQYRQTGQYMPGYPSSPFTSTGFGLGFDFPDLFGMNSFFTPLDLYTPAASRYQQDARGRRMEAAPNDAVVVTPLLEVPETKDKPEVGHDVNRASEEVTIIDNTRNDVEQ